MTTRAYCGLMDTRCSLKSVLANSSITSNTCKYIHILICLIDHLWVHMEKGAKWWSLYGWPTQTDRYLLSFSDYPVKGHYIGMSELSHDGSFLQELDPVHFPRRWLEGLDGHILSRTTSGWSPHSSMDCAKLTWSKTFCDPRGSIGIGNVNLRRSGRCSVHAGVDYLTYSISLLGIVVILIFSNWA